MKDLFFKLILLFTPLLVAMGAINYYIDPLHLFSNAYYKKAGELLLKNNIAFESCNEKKLLVEFLKHQPDSDLLILGSSRTAILDTPQVKKKLLNLCTSHVLLYDMIAAYGLYTTTHNTPKEIIMGIDPWYFNIHKTAEDDFYLKAYYTSMLLKMNFSGKQITVPELKSMSFYEQCKQMFSFNYFQNSITSIIRNRFAEPQPRLATEKDLFIKQSNGALHYSRRWQENPADIATAVTRELSATNLHGTEDYTSLSEEHAALLESFLNYLQKNHIKVHLLLTAYHPSIWQHIQKHERYHILMEAEKKIKQMAKQKGIAVSGSYDPSVYHLIDTDFYDAIHINYKGLKKMFPTGLN